ncbi:hypothetical protein [Nocardia sp. R6R-6]|uniref:hypothetical protein n=1 Tax=Nocardia sp. R6R-6 TaxID=3459303 RepID=UPI00403E1847
MKLRLLLHRRPADRVPQLPASEPRNGHKKSPDTPDSAVSPRGARAATQEERLERLLTPTELDLALHHRL